MTKAHAALRSVHTSNFPAILQQLGASLLATTYQAGKLVMVRNDGGVINTHIRALSKPMGMALGDQRLAIGTAQEIIEFRNVPAVTSRLGPSDKLDACYLPRHAKYVTFQLAEVAVTRRLFAAILDRIERLALPPPVVARCSE